jgi:hypothetical protein
MKQNMRDKKTHLVYGTIIGGLLAFTLYQYWDKRRIINQNNRLIQELELDVRAGQILISKVLLSKTVETFPLPSRTKVKMPVDYQKKFQISTRWDSDLGNHLFKRTANLKTNSTVVILNISTFGNTAVTLAHKLKQAGKNIKVVYLDINSDAIKLMSQYCKKDYPNLSCSLIDFDTYKKNRKIDGQTLQIIQKANFVVVQGPWSDWKVNDKKLKKVYSHSSIASFFSVSDYAQFKRAFMRACIENNKTVIETAYSFIADRLKSNETLDHCDTSDFIPVSKPEDQSNENSGCDGILIRTPKI